MWKTLDRLRRWLSPPGFEDKEKARRARLLNTVFLTVFLLQLISLLIDFLAGNGDWLLLLVYLVGLTITLGLWALMRRGQLRLASQGLVISTWLLVTIFVVVNGTIRSPVTSLYLLVIVTAGLILDRRAVILFTMLCSLTVLGLVIAENEGLFPWQEFSVTFEQWATYTLFFIVAALFVLLAVQDIVFSLASASRELDERQKIEVTLRESEERYRNFIEHSFEGVWQMSFDDPISTGLPPEEQVRRIHYQGYITDCNNAFAQMYGLTSRAEMLGKRLIDLYGGTPHEQNKRATLELVKNNYHSGNRETREVNIQGEAVYFLNNAVGVIENGYLVKLWGSQRDISLRKKIEQALQHRSDQLATLNRIGTAISGLQDLQGVLREILQQLQTALLLDVFYVGLLDQQNGQITYPIMYDSGRFWQEEPWKMAEGSFANQVITTRMPILKNRTPEEIETAEKTVTTSQRTGDVSRISASLLMVPLIAGELVSGLVSVQTFTPNAYTQEHLDFLTLASFQIAITIENAILYEGLQKELGERQRAEAETRQLNIELEQRVQERTSQLQSVVKELEAFSYSVSHDLRAPLRAIDGYSRLIMTEYSQLLDSEGLQYLENVRISTQRMGALIDDLLKLSRVSRTELNRVPVSLSELAGEIIAQLSKRDPDRKVEVAIQPDMVVDGDANLLHLALENLFDNAWKFTSRGASAQIKFGSQMQDGEQVFYIQDNGAGFDMRYANQLFQAFQRLHSQEDYEGTGIGLATVRRIIQRHGGRIWSEAEEGVGATFYFTL